MIDAQRIEIGVFVNREVANLRIERQKRCGETVAKSVAAYCTKSGTATEGWCRCWELVSRQKMRASQMTRDSCHSMRCQMSRRPGMRIAATTARARVVARRTQECCLFGRDFDVEGSRRRQSWGENVCGVEVLKSKSILPDACEASFMAAREFIGKVVPGLILLDCPAKCCAGLHARVCRIALRAERVYSLDFAVPKISVTSPWRSLAPERVMIFTTPPELAHIPRHSCC